MWLLVVVFVVIHGSVDDIIVVGCYLEFTRDAIFEWVQLADFYTWPHIQLFDSWDDLLQQLTTTDLAAVSRQMAQHNAQDKRDITRSWESILATISAGAAAKDKANSYYSNNVQATSSLLRGVAEDASVVSTSLGRSVSSSVSRSLPEDPNWPLQSQYGVSLVPGCTAAMESQSAAG